MKIKSSRRFGGVFSMTVSNTSFLVHTKIGPELGDSGKLSSLLTITSPSTPISNSACPTRPPPIIIAGSTFDDAMTVVAFTFLPLVLLTTTRLEDVLFVDDDDGEHHF
jgi:hypothetical protein